MWVVASCCLQDCVLAQRAQKACKASTPRFLFTFKQEDGTETSQTF